VCGRKISVLLLVVAREKEFHDRISFYHFIKKGGKKEKKEKKKG
jgi:hypothetical protein